jgi:hypothetical protein
MSAAFTHELNKAQDRIAAIAVWSVLERAQWGAELRQVRYYDGGPVCMEATLPEGFIPPAHGEVYRDYARVASCKLSEWASDPRVLAWWPEYCRKTTASRYSEGDAVCLSDDFPEFQRGWPALIIHRMEHPNEDGQPVYMVKFFHIQNYGCGSDGTLFVAESNLRPLPLTGSLERRPFGSYADHWHYAV